MNIHTLAMIDGCISRELVAGNLSAVLVLNELYNEAFTLIYGDGVSLNID